jgi:hypothetical protein
MKEFLSLPANPFLWRGYDGSEIKALRLDDANLYCSALGNARNEIVRKAGAFADQDVGVALWGVGNHGGGPSRKDLSDIMELMDEKKGEYRILHSTPEAYFAMVKPDGDLFWLAFALLHQELFFDFCHQTETGAIRNDFVQIRKGLCGRFSFGSLHL